mmetsp:Transcript_7825/g.11426  ORF Transcript_7825/g.11426 Transcript_7825/m.11426 type:complete len:351 (+) Transcript_7825:303-1355(+)
MLLLNGAVSHASNSLTCGAEVQTVRVVLGQAGVVHIAHQGLDRDLEVRLHGLGLDRGCESVHPDRRPHSLVVHGTNTAPRHSALGRSATTRPAGGLDAHALPGSLVSERHVRCVRGSRSLGCAALAGVRRSCNRQLRRALHVLVDLGEVLQPAHVVVVLEAVEELEHVVAHREVVVAAVEFIVGPCEVLKVVLGRHDLHLLRNRWAQQCKVKVGDGLSLHCNGVLQRGQIRLSAVLAGKLSLQFVGKPLLQKLALKLAPQHVLLVSLLILKEALAIVFVQTLLWGHRLRRVLLLLLWGLLCPFRPEEHRTVVGLDQSLAKYKRVLRWSLSRRRGTTKLAKSLPESVRSWS